MLMLLVLASSQDVPELTGVSSKDERPRPSQTAARTWLGTGA